jgi:hypothetical protein
MTNSLNASFGFVGSDSGGGNVSGFECALDAGAFSSCATGKSYSSLSDGIHTFKVRATDTAGNLGLATTYTWTIDTTTPMASLSAYPDSITNQTVANFGFSATPPSGGSIIGYECQLDSGAWSSCSSPKSYSSLLQGNHSFGVRSIDNNLNVSDPMTYSWTIDTTVPVLTISGHPAVLTNSASAQFIFAAMDSGDGAIDTYYCQLDGAGFNQCSSPRDLSGLAQGSHVFEVKVTDTAGNTSATQS